MWYRGRSAPQETVLFSKLAVRLLAMTPAQRGPQTVAKSAKRNIQDANRKLSHVWKAEEIEWV